MTAEQNPQPLTILIVDDDARVRRALARYLELDGHVVEVALTGAQALERVGTQPWDLLCLDAQLPDIPGPVLARQIQALAPSAYTVLVPDSPRHSTIADCSPSASTPCSRNRGRQTSWNAFSSGRTITWSRVPSSKLPEHSLLREAQARGS